jgi:hypothetical protein
VTLPEHAAAVVRECVEQVRPIAGVAGFYVGGSLATGDYHPGISDLDLVAVVELPLTREQESALADVHDLLIRTRPEAAKLHCFYVPLPDIADVVQPHVNWAHRELYRRPMSGVVRAELLRHGVTVIGPPPAELFPPVSDAQLADAARAELTGYWSGALAKRHLWLQDVYVDLGLTTLARVEATLADGRLITKTEAIGRLDRFGVPNALVAEIGARRRGVATPLSPAARTRRATVARRLVRAGIARLVGPAVR